MILSAAKDCFEAKVSFTSDDAPAFKLIFDEATIKHTVDGATHIIPHQVAATALYMKKKGDSYEYRVAAALCKTQHRNFRGVYTVKVTWTAATSNEKRELEASFEGGRKLNESEKEELSVAHPRLGILLGSKLREIDTASKEDSDPAWKSGASLEDRESILANIVSHVYEGLARGVGYLWLGAHDSER
jgi:hypothetical protein